MNELDHGELFLGLLTWLVRKEGGRGGGREGGREEEGGKREEGI